MADERKIGAIEIDRLYDFLDGLQTSGYTIDPRQYLALSDLLIALIARGYSLDELPLKTLIAPLICSTLAEQKDFYERFDVWYTQTVDKDTSFDEKLPLLSENLRLKKWGFLSLSRTTVIRILSITVIIALFVWMILSGNKIDSNVLFYSIISLIVALLGWLGWRLRILYQENQYITRELANQEPVYAKVPVKAYIQEVMPVMQFKPIVSALRKRTQVPSSEVDVDRTIENALNHNNWLEIIYRQRQVMPEYVVLIDRKSRLDQQACFVQEVLAKLEADGVWLHQYEFSGDPRICFPLDRKDTPLRLKDLQSRHPDARLLIFSGTNELLNPLTGLLQDWLESLSYWQDRAILTPDKLQKVLLEELQSRDFAVLPMTIKGLASLVHAFETDNAPFLTTSEPNVPAQLIERPMRWTGRDTPPEAEVKTLVQDVKYYLGENGFYWLCATTVYPELRWELTLFLGSALKDEFGQQLLSPDVLLRIARLPWFRVGYMPDWIRLAIMNSMTPAKEENIRNILRQLLSTAYKGKDFDLIFSFREPDSFIARTGRLLNSFIGKLPDISELRDQIFVKFITQYDSRKLAVVLPSGLQENINDSKTSVDVEPRHDRKINPAPIQSTINPKINTQSSSQYRDEVLKPFFSYVKSGESFYIIGAPGVGKTRFMDFLMGDDPEILRTNTESDRERVKKHYLGEEVAAKTWLARVDMNRMRSEIDWGFHFFELLLNTILLTCNRCEPTSEIEKLKTALAMLESEVIESKDALKAHRLFEMAVNMLCQSNGIKICFLFDEFDATYLAMPREVFAQLRAIRDANKYRVSYILFLRNLPEVLRDPIEVIGFYELISRNMVGLGPYSYQDTNYIISQLEKRREYTLPQDRRDWLVVNSGGHPGLIYALFLLLKEHPHVSAQMQNPEWCVKQESVKEEFRKLWTGLLEDEQNGLLEFARGNQTSISLATGKLLTAKGLLKPAASGVDFFSPLFKVWVMR